MAENNKVMMNGVVGTDEIRISVTPNGKKVANFPIIVDKFYYDVTAWEELAEEVDKMKKGEPIKIDGRLAKKSWEDKSGNKHYQTYIVAEEISFPSSESDDDIDEDEFSD